MLLYVIRAKNIADVWGSRLYGKLLSVMSLILEYNFNCNCPAQTADCYCDLVAIGLCYSTQVGGGLGLGWIFYLVDVEHISIPVSFIHAERAFYVLCYWRLWNSIGTSYYSLLLSLNSLIHCSSSHAGITI